MAMNDEVLALAGQVERLSRSIREEKEAKRTSNRLLRWVIGAMAVVLLLVGGIAVWALGAADTANTAIEEVVEVRTGSRQVSCNDRRKIAEAHNLLVIGIVTRDFTRPVPAELLPSVGRQLVPVPDCSTTQAVNDFYDGKTVPTKPDPQSVRP